jgi:hypothetical protein
MDRLELDIDGLIHLKNAVEAMHDEIWDGPNKESEIGINRKIERLRKNGNELYGRVHALEHSVDRSAYKSARIARMLGRHRLNRQINRNVYQLYGM